jgi:hypothetical protein
MTIAWKGIVGRPFPPADFILYVQGLKWGAWRPSFCVLHNTAIPTFAEWHTEPGEQRMQNLQSYYRDVQHWSGGPHLFVDDMVIWAFTPLTVPGVHSPSWNALSWGIEMVGNYETEPLSYPVLQNTASALATLHDALGLNPLTLRFHKEDPLTDHKTCPGRAIIKADVVGMVQQKIMARHQGDHLPSRGQPIPPGVPL